VRPRSGAEDGFEDERDGAPSRLRIDLGYLVQCGLGLGKPPLSRLLGLLPSTCQYHLCTLVRGSFRLLGLFSSLGARLLQELGGITLGCGQQLACLRLCTAHAFDQFSHGYSSWPITSSSACALSASTILR